ncbi:unnamed protein product [Prorocentrum cordatum]|uniref:Uncharacterized protein n=1 Tax=Prorocentrum cordatum TaxID=2364126 RepID=A0ABN9PMN1_9DINO|nr:unnamed protein product [Polarella glacialis]
MVPISEPTKVGCKLLQRWDVALDVVSPRGRRRALQPARVAELEAWHAWLALGPVRTAALGRPRRQGAWRLGPRQLASHLAAAKAFALASLAALATLGASGVASRFASARAAIAHQRERAERRQAGPGPRGGWGCGGLHRCQGPGAALADPTTGQA